MKNTKVGKCCLCGKVRDLTYEHVPPRSAFNKDRIFETYKFLDWVEEKGTWKDKIKIKGGLGGYTLCKSCNNMGGRYGREYKEWAERGITNLKDHCGQEWSGVLKDVYPIRFLKGVITMFCSLNGPQFAEKNPDIRDFVNSKNCQELPPRITILMYLNTSKLITRTGITALIELGAPSKIYVVSELNFPPFGFAMYIGSAKYERLTDITWFDGYGYDEKVDLPLRLPILERNIPVPADYRTESEINFDRIKNQVEEFGLKRKVISDSK